MYLNEKVRFSLAIVIWIAVIVVGGLTYYVNHYLPHGEEYSTGEYVCPNDTSGPCREQYKEDLRGLDIPEWAKFLRKSDGQLVFFGLLFAGLTLSSWKKGQED
jgi:hypothetical protein